MKTGLGIGGVLLIGLLVWWLTQKKEVQASELLPGEPYPEESEYEKLHKTVPITKYVVKEIPVFETERRLIIEADSEASTGLIVVKVLAIGGKVETTYKNLVQALLTSPQEQTLSNLDYVKRIRAPMQPVEG